MKRTSNLLTTILTLVILCGFSNAVFANPAPGKKKPAKIKTSKIASNNAVTDANEPEPDVQSSVNQEYKCELGNTLVMYEHPDDQQSLAMRWKNRLYKLTRIETSTGAHRYENQKAGLVWINIPAKGLLLDSHRGKQLANECKTTTIALATDKELNAPQSTQTQIK